MPLTLPISTRYPRRWAIATDRGPARAGRAVMGAAVVAALAFSGLAGCASNTTSSPPASSPPVTTPDPTSSATGTAKPLAVPVIERNLATGLTVPWGVAALPDGSFLVAERDSARVLLITADGRKSGVGSVAGVVPAGEGGLLGLAVSPTFSTDRMVFAYTTTRADNRVVAMRWPEGGQLGAPKTVLAGIPNGTIHNGGRLAFGPDGLLYVTTGDGGVSSRSQDKGSLGGKILRIRSDGTIPADNPFAGSSVWSYGHRNVQGIAWDSSKRLWASEFGQSTFDELNLITRGGNYGWPLVEGPSNDPNFVAPFATWRPTAIASPSGLAIVNDVAYLGALRGERLWQVPLTGNDKGQPTSRLSGALGRIRTVVAIDGTQLVVTTSNTDGRVTPRRDDDKLVLIRLR